MKKIAVCLIILLAFGCKKKTPEPNISKNSEPSSSDYRFSAISTGLFFPKHAGIDTIRLSLSVNGAESDYYVFVIKQNGPYYNWSEVSRGDVDTLKSNAPVKTGDVCEWTFVYKYHPGQYQSTSVRYGMPGAWLTNITTASKSTVLKFEADSIQFKSGSAQKSWKFTAP